MPRLWIDLLSLLSRAIAPNRPDPILTTWRETKGSCDFDVKHNFTGSATYFVPLHGNRFIEGWQLSTIAMAHSGNPFSVQDGFDRVGLNDPAGTPGERPNLVPGRSNNPIRWAGR